jgi:hypothetical protein
MPILLMRYLTHLVLRRGRVRIQRSMRAVDAHVGVSCQYSRVCSKRVTDIQFMEPRIEH